VLQCVAMATTRSDACENNVLYCVAVCCNELQ